MSKRYTLNGTDAKGLLKVILYTVATAVVVGLIDFFSAFEFPIELLWIAPVVNTLLVALKNFFESK